MANEDKKRYEKQSKQLEKKGYFITEDGKRSTDAKKANQRDSAKEREAEVAKPKIATSAYLYFSAQSLKDKKAKNPSIGVVDASKHSGEIWSKMTLKERQPFEKLHQ